MLDYKISLGYTEWVVRQACAWTFQSTEFPKVSREEKSWVVSLASGFDEATISLLERNLNEFRLREIIDLQTADLRMKMVNHSLENTYKSMKE